jgi:hypothetical protein
VFSFPYPSSLLSLLVRLPFLWLRLRKSEGRKARRKQKTVEMVEKKVKQEVKERK